MDEDERKSADQVMRATEVDAVLAEFGGDPRAAIRALLDDLDVLANDYESTVSRGFVRGVMP